MSGSGGRFDGVVQEIPKEGEMCIRDRYKTSGTGSDGALLLVFAETGENAGNAVIPRLRASAQRVSAFFLLLIRTMTVRPEAVLMGSVKSVFKQRRMVCSFWAYRLRSFLILV